MIMYGCDVGGRSAASVHVARAGLAARRARGARVAARPQRRAGGGRAVQRQRERARWPRQHDPLAIHIHW